MSELVGSPEDRFSHVTAHEKPIAAAPTKSPTSTIPGFILAPKYMCNETKSQFQLKLARGSCHLAILDEM